MTAKRPTWLILGMLLVLAILVAACGPQATSEPEPTSTRPLRPTFTPTVVPTDTPSPLPPTPTDTPTPLPTDTPAEPPTPTPEPPTPTPEIGPLAIVVGSDRVNARSGPGTAYPVVGRVAGGTELEIVGRNEASDWWQVCCVDGQEAWLVDRLVTIQGDTSQIAVADVPPPPPTNTPRPVPPTNTPAPTPTPAPVFVFNKYDSPQPGPNSNPVVTFFGMTWNRDLTGVVSGYNLVVDGPLGRQEAPFGAVALRGNPGLPSEFVYNAKVEFLGTADGTYNAYVADGGGNQASEAYQFTVSGNTRVFYPRWRER